MKANLIVLLLLAAALAACGGETTREGYTLDVNDTHGFSVQRPTEWGTREIPNSYSYVVDDETRTYVQVANYESIANATDSIVIFYELYEQNPSLEGWTTAAEESWRDVNIESELIGEPPNAAIYHLDTELPESPTTIVALVEAEGGPPMSISLDSMTYTLDELRQQGLIEVLEVMINTLAYHEGDL